MANKPVKELSRRDALKLLGAAAGASVLANLPSKWSTPELTAGVLPVHAQTSVCTDTALVVHVTATGDGDLSGDSSPGPDSTILPAFTVGSSATWNCGDRCIYVILQGTNVEASSTVEVTIMNAAPTLVHLSGTNFYWIYLNAATGVYDFSTTVLPASVVVEGCPPFNTGA
jgi:hypothetical protein